MMMSSVTAEEVFGLHFTSAISIRDMDGYNVCVEFFRIQCFDILSRLTCLQVSLNDDGFCQRKTIWSNSLARLLDESLCFIS